MAYKYKNFNIKTAMPAFYSIETPIEDAVGAANPYKNYDYIKQNIVETNYYTQLDATIPAVAYIKLSTLNFITSDIPPKYVQSFSCKRVGDGVGSFSLQLVCPVDTFSKTTDELNVKLLMLSAQIDTAVAADNSKYVPCELEYGWTGKKILSCRYKNAGITGMTVNYGGNNYTYVIQGLLNSAGKEGYKISKIISKDDEAWNEINRANLSEPAEALLGDSTEFNFTEHELGFDYDINIPAGAAVYAPADTKNNYKKVGTQSVALYSLGRFRDRGFTEDHLYFRNGNNYYKVSDIQIISRTTGETSSISSDSIDFTKIEAGSKISHKVELLANYIFGKNYKITVEHSDKTYDEDTQLANLLKEYYEFKANKDTTNQTTTSLYNWLLNMISLCWDETESDFYSTYGKQFDVDKDGIITASDLSIYKNDTYEQYVNTYNKYVKYQSDLNTLRSTKSGEINAELRDGNTYLATLKTDISKIKKELSTLRKSVLSDVLNVHESNVVSEMTAYITVNNMSDKELIDYTKKKLEESLSEVSEVVNTYSETGIRQSIATAYTLQFIESGQGTSRIYIGPKKTDYSGYNYLIGNNQKNSTVIDFSVSNDLVALVANCTTYLTTNSQYAIDPDTGGIIKVPLSTESEVVKSPEEYATHLANEILSSLSTGAYKATLTVISDMLSRQLQVTDNIKVLCLANSGKSMYSGTYYINGINDELDSNGILNTKFELQLVNSDVLQTVKKLLLKSLAAARES